MRTSFGGRDGSRGLRRCIHTVSPALSASMASIASYNVQALPIPANALYGEASSINDAGLIAGWYTTGNIWSAVAWNAAGTQMLDLGKLAGYQSALAKGINASGSIVGYVLSAGFASSRAFRWTRSGGMQPLATLGGTGGIALSINASGTIAGWASDAVGTIHAVKWTPSGTVVDLNPPGATSEATGVNDAGDIVGFALIPPAAEHAYLWRHDGVNIDLGTLGGRHSFANGVNNNLVVVGVAERPSPQAPIAFAWAPSTGMRAITPMGPNSEAYAVSDLNRVVGKQTSSGVLGLTLFHGAAATLPDLAPAKGPFSAATSVNRCGTAVGSSASPQPTNGNSVPVIWRQSPCD
ncbi:MAG: hypothetical protein U0132_23270 [Gemmatimonadaceae bacterium]